MNQKLNTIIESMGVYLPPQLVSTSQVMQDCNRAIAFPLEKITGIRNRHMAGDTEFSIDLARNAVSNCLANSKFDASDIDLLVCCNISRYDAPHLVSFEPCTSVRLRQHFGFSNATSFDVANACAGMFTGVYIVDALIKTGAIRRGMVVSGEYITHLTQNAQRTIESFMDSRLACLTLGDAGAALILEGTTNKQTGFQEIELRTFGGYSHFCIAKMTGQDGIAMFTDSVNMTDVAIRSGAKNALDVLARANWPPESFQQLIMHQTSSMTMNSAKGEINRLLKSRVCHDGNTVNNLAERGNTASTAHFVALADNIRKGTIHKGDKIVFSITASGLTIGTALYVFDDLPLSGGTEQQTAHQKETVIGSPGRGMDSNTPRVRIESVGTAGTGVVGEMNAMELLKHAATSCLKRSSYKINDVGVLIYSGVYRDEYVMEPAYASLLAGAMNMNATTPETENKTFAFDIFNGSVGFLNACYVAQQIMVAGNCKTAMIVASENENNAGSFPDELLGIRETASALVLDTHSSDQKGFSRFHFKYDEGSLQAYRTYYSDIEPRLHIEKDKDLAALYITCIVSAVLELLHKEELELSSIDRVFPPQISSVFIAQLSKALGLPLDRFVDAVGNGPDLFSSSLPYALEFANVNGLIKDGDLGLLISVGSGIQVGCAIYHF